MSRQCIIILSDKSSGSSALFRELIKNPDTRRVTFTTHGENETLFWNKAAAILGKPQASMRYGSLPLEPDSSRRELIELLRKNIPGYVVPDTDEELIFGGWRQLLDHFGPVFLEKSPHHLHCWSALELLLESMRRNPDIDYRFIGLVRNPMDTLYSMWQRWHAIPEKTQLEWMNAYANLIRLQPILGDKLITVKYEELVSDKERVSQMVSFLGNCADSGIGDGFHATSIQKWKLDNGYGFKLSHEVEQLAKKLGYHPDEYANEASSLWPLRRLLNAPRYKLRKIYQKIRKTVFAGRVASPSQ